MTVKQHLFTYTDPDGNKLDVWNKVDPNWIHIQVLDIDNDWASMDIPKKALAELMEKINDPVDLESK
jgi:hypothetical protein